MDEMNARLSSDANLAGAYHAAHDDYLAARSALAKDMKLDVPEVAEISAGGMPDRVKCLHSLVAHSLATEPGVNPLGDEALNLIGNWWENGNCLERRAEGK